jgi:O-antigen ligase
MVNFAIPRLAPRGHLADGAGLLGLSVFALSAWSSPFASRVGLALCLSALAASPAARTALRRDPLFRLGLLFAAFLLLQTFRGAMLFPETLERQWIDCGKWLLLSFGFLAVAWWLNGDLDRIRRILILALMGLLIGMLRRADWTEVLTFHTGNQTGFQMYPGSSGLISATALLGLLLFAERIFGTSGKGWTLWIRAFFWFVSLYLCAYILAASQSRTAWLAAALVFPAVLGYRYRHSLRGRGVSRRWLPLLPLLALALLVGGIALNAESLLSRIAPDRETTALILQGKTGDLPSSSFTYRFHAQRFGFEKWLERPLLGWGTSSVKPLLRGSNQPELFNREAGRWLGHVHNTYLEILIRFGLVGAAFLAIGAWSLARAVARAGSPGRLPQDYFLFLLGALAMLPIWALGVFQFMAEAWGAYWLLAMGIGYTFALHSGETRRLQWSAEPERPGPQP